MAEQSDTLEIGSLRTRPDNSEQPLNSAGNLENHPDIAAAARARIAALPGSICQPDYQLGTENQLAPTTPTAELIVDKSQLAQNIQAKSVPLVRRRRRIPSAVMPFLTAIGVFLLVLLLFKAPVIISQAQYAISSKPQTPATLTVPAAEVVPPENTISIPKINMKAPVGYESSIQEAAIQRALQDGVVHYGNTAMPGTPGNVAIFGHSSNDWWEPGNFKFVFVLLDKLSPGDRITLDYQSQRFIYEVTGSKVVEPTDVGVLNPTATPTLTLITCTPPGTSLRRLVVTAKQISPDPSHTAVAAVTPSKALPPASLTSSTNFFDVFTQALNGVVSGISSLFGGNSSTQNHTPSTGQIPATK